MNFTGCLHVSKQKQSFLNLETFEQLLTSPHYFNSTNYNKQNKVLQHLVLHTISISSLFDSITYYLGIW